VGPSPGKTTFWPDTESLGCTTKTFGNVGDSGPPDRARPARRKPLGGKRPRHRYSGLEQIARRLYMMGRGRRSLLDGLLSPCLPVGNRAFQQCSRVTVPIPPDREFGTLGCLCE